MINWGTTKYNYAELGIRGEVSPDTVGLMPLLQQVIQTGRGCIHKSFFDGYTEKVIEDLVKTLVELKGRKILDEHSSVSAWGHMYLYNDAVVEVNYDDKTKYSSVQFVSTNEKITKACMEAGAKLKQVEKKGFVFAISSSQSGLKLTRIGYAGVPLIRDNYNKKVIEDYDYVIEDLKSKTPSGRITILDGGPGGGKSFLVRGILSDVNNAVFILVPPQMTSSLSGPELLPLLVKTKAENGKKSSIVLILEDADEVLSPRAMDNISSISAVLNLSDGIFGSLFDVRIVATTNAKVKELDTAILRDGRLSRRINVPPFSYSEANVVFQRLVQDSKKDLPKPVSEYENGMKPKNDKTTFTLAEIYKAARNNGWKPEEIAEEPGNDAYDDKRYLDDMFDDDY